MNKQLRTLAWAWSPVPVLALGCQLLTGCQTGGNLAQTEHFAQYDGKGNATYYRISVAGFGKNGKVKYRSGWFDARAVDDLFGVVVGSEPDLKSVTAERQREAVQRTFEKYMQALESNDTANIPAYKQRYEEALQGVAATGSAGESPVAALEHANEKFVILLANDPDQIIEALRNRVKSSKLAESVGLLMRGQAAQADQASQLRLEVLAARLEGIQKSLAAQRDAVPDDAGTAALAQALRETLAEVEALQ